MSKKKILTDLEKEIKHDQDLISLKSELQSVRQKYHSLLKKDSLQEKILLYNQELIKSLPPNKNVSFVKPKPDQEIESAVLLGACYHIGEVIPAEQVPGNEYNFETFCKRIQFVVDEVIKFTTSQSNVYYDELVYCLLGDMVSGILHDLNTNNQFNIVQQTHAGAYILAEAIKDLSIHFPKLRVLCLSGNHGRTGQGKYSHDKQQLNWDYVLYNNLALLLQNVKNVQVIIPQTWYGDIDIKGYKVFCTHGDTLKGGTGNPINIVSKDAAKWSQIKNAKNEYFNFYLTSHYHQKAEMQTPLGAHMMAGCLKGTCTYAQNMGYHSDPIQTFFSLGKFGKRYSIDINVKYQNYKKSRYSYELTKALSDHIKK